MNNYIENLLNDEFLLIYIGAWDPDLPEQCKSNPKVKFFDNSCPAKEIKKGDTVAIMANGDDSKFCSTKSQADLAAMLKKKNARGLIFGKHRGFCPEK